MRLGKRFWVDETGSFSFTFGLTLLPIMFMVGLSIDYANIQRERFRLQETADSSALYAAKQWENAGVSTSDLSTNAKEVVESNFDIDGAVGVNFDKQTNRIKVTLTKNYTPTFLALMHPDDVPIGVLAEVAFSEEYEGAKCFMSLTKSGKGVLNLNGNAIIDAEPCSVQVNSSSSDAVDLNGNGTQIKADSNCFVGGVQSGYSRIQPPPEDNCQVVNDPFDEFTQPTITRCSYTDYKVTANKTVTLNPGVYCGGLSIGSGANVTFKKGLYVMKNGAFKVTGGGNSATLTGKYVTFYFTGTDVALDFAGGTNFNFIAMDQATADAAGDLIFAAQGSYDAKNASDLAGFLVYFDPAAEIKLTSSFTGNSYTYFEGVLYFGNRDLTINGDSEVNTGSPFSVVVANTIVLNGNGIFNFNVDKNTTTLPVPDELYEKTIVPYLVR